MSRDLSSVQGALDFELSQNESRVLHSIVKWPELSDQAIHSKIGMKKSTFSSIKTRLKENGYYKRLFIPNFPKIGFEMLHLMFGQLNRFTTYEERMRIANETIKGFTEDFFVVSEANQAFNLSVSQNYTEYAKNLETFLQLYSENKFLSKEGMFDNAFPFEISQCFSFLDYESLLAKSFGFISEEYEKRYTIPTGPVEKAKLSRAERKVLAGLVKYPEETDTLIAEEVGVSRNTVANAKRKFLKEEICFTRVIPNIKKLDHRTLVFSFVRFNPKISDEQRSNTVELVRNLMAPIFYINKNLDGFIISAHASEEEFDQLNDELMSFYMKNEIVLDDPVTYKIDSSKMNVIKDLEFLPSTLKVLGFDDKSPISEQK
ncbi:MAG: Lrp/AsnC family transcriptional regulator [Candidatus Heimdallarchaeota archaeon]|nr:Lrp/AsnC family transcriptional regulator [Candidatus Heimdallarchaeota archaeon]